MNLFVLERMIRECDLSKDALRYLVDCRAECEWLDYKRSLHLDIDKQLCDFAKDMVAMKVMQLAMSGSGSTTIRALQLILEHLEGRPAQAVNVSMDQPINEIIL